MVVISLDFLRKIQMNNQNIRNDVIFFAFQVHRLVVVGDDEKVAGVVSLSDILTYLVLRPVGKSLILIGLFFHAKWY